MTLFEHYLEKIRKNQNSISVDMEDSEVLNYLKTNQKPGTKKEQPAAEEIKPEDSEEFEPQEGDIINHKNGNNYRFTNGSWLPADNE